MCVWFAVLRWFFLQLPRHVPWHRTRIRIIGYSIAKVHFVLSLSSYALASMTGGLPLRGTALRVKLLFDGKISPVTFLKRAFLRNWSPPNFKTQVSTNLFHQNSFHYSMMISRIIPIPKIHPSQITKFLVKDQNVMEFSVSQWLALCVLLKRHELLPQID